jgi:hypothetical protein
MNRIAVDLLEEAVGEPPPITPVGKKNPAAADSERVGDVKKSAAKVKAKGLALKKPKA